VSRPGYEGRRRANRRPVSSPSGAELNPIRCERGEGAWSASTTQRWDRRRHRPTIHRTAAGTREAERQFRRIIGYRDLAKLTTVIDRELDKPTVPTPIEEAAIVVTV
jgi:hypothetical protein